MLAQLFRQFGGDGDREAVVTADRRVDWRWLAASADSITGSLHPFRQERVLVRFLPIPESFALLGALDQLGTDAFLVDAQASSEQCAMLARTFHLSAVLTPVDRAECSSESPFVLHEPFPDRQPGSGKSQVTVLTSGSTGQPKAACHDWHRLARPVRQLPEYDATRWFLAYRPQLYAGLQVMLQCFVNRGTLIVPRSAATANEVVQLMRDERAQFVSATPSYWRRLLITANRAFLGDLAVRQITLGGEVVDQQILDSLHSVFPTARLVHIYATTELGRCFSVTDGQAGFPRRFLEGTSADGIELRLADNELIVRSPNRMLGYDAYSANREGDTEWFRTGDLVEIVGDRVYFVGRRSDMINVAGDKVHPLQVEQVIRTIESVKDVRVYGERSSIAGQLVACDVVMDPRKDAEAVRREIQQRCRDELSPSQRPRFIRFVQEISMTSAGKTTRASQS